MIYMVENTKTIVGEPCSMFVDGVGRGPPGIRRGWKGTWGYSLTEGISLVQNESNGT